MGRSCRWFFGSLVGFLFVVSCRPSSEAEQAWVPIQQAIEAGDAARLWGSLSSASQITLERLARRHGWTGTGQAFFQRGQISALSALRFDPTKRTRQTADRAELFFLDAFGQAVTLVFQKEAHAWKLHLLVPWQIATSRPATSRPVPPLPSSPPHP